MALVPFPSPQSGAVQLPPDDDDELPGGKMSFLEHLDELRKRIVRACLAIAGGVIVGFFFIDKIFKFLLAPAKAALPPGTFYRHDLIGCRVETTRGEVVGVVTDVEGTMAGSRLVIDSASGEVLVPLATEICPEIDTAGKRIVINPPAGLMDVNRRD